MLNVVITRFNLLCFEVSSDAYYIVLSREKSTISGVGRDFLLNQVGFVYGAGVRQ